MSVHSGTSSAITTVTTGQTVKTDLEAAAWLFEQLAVQADQPADRPRIRRALEEAAATWPPGQEDRWWKWLVEASRSLGLKCQIIDCTFDQLAEMAREGARIVTRVGPERQWTAIATTHGRRFHLLRPLRDQNQLWVTPRRLRSLLEVAGRDELTRCLVIDAGFPGGEVGLGNPGERTPLQRVWGLLRPESGDIWIIFVFAVVTGMLALATPLAVETLVNTVAFGRLLQPVVILALMLLAFLSFSAAIRALQTYVVEIIQRRLFARVAADLAYRLPRTDIEALDGKVGRELVNRFFDVVTVQKVCAQLLLDGINLALATLIGMAVLAFYHPWLLGFAVVLLAMLAFAIFVLGRGAISTSVKESKKKYMMAAWLEELISCPIAFRHSGAAEFALDRADRLIFEYLSARKEHFRILIRQIVFVLALQALASTALLGLGGWLVISGQLTLGQLVAAELIVSAIVGSFAKLGKHMEAFYDLLAAIDKLGQLFDLPIERQDGLLTLPSGRPAAVRISNATYTNPAGSLCLSNLQLTIASGERVVLNGASGSGKSQLLDLLYGNRTPDSGHVAINGLDPRDLRPDTLRKYVALVRHQEIFSGTIAENVHLERPDVSTNDVRDALEQVGLLERVLSLPEGLETPLVESGYPLTTSQARKLMLARAISGRPRLMLIDELLDCFNDQDAVDLMDMLCEPTQPWTLVVVSGRSAIIERAGRLIEMGHLTPAHRQEVAHAG
jgi:putative ABC transport system ATP-binding protein